MKFKLTFTLTLILMNSVILLSQQNVTEIKAGNVTPGKIDAKAFTLLKEAEINIMGTAGYFNLRNENDHIFYSWIINSKTRKLVWHSLKDSLLKEEDGILKYQTKIKLSKGIYEIYYTGAPEKSNEINNISDFIRQLGNSFSRVFESRQKIYSDDYIDELAVVITAPDSVLTEMNYNELIRKIKSHSIISVTNITDEAKVQNGFSISRGVKLHVYSIGEVNQEGMLDYSWITNLDKNIIVWEMTRGNSSPAGGAPKNLLFDDVIDLPKGNYSVSYLTDKSHSFGNWNSLPPYDPQFWGVTINLVNDSDKSAIKFFDEQSFKNEYVIAEITRLGDNEYLKKAFNLDKDTNLIRIIAIGEGDPTEMYDYGWIIDEKTRIPVWEMEYNETTEAGGSKKNRIFNKVIKLPRGMYSVYFQTDNSNSYRKFVLAPPNDKENYGIRVLREE